MGKHLDFFKSKNVENTDEIINRRREIADPRKIYFPGKII